MEKPKQFPHRVTLDVSDDDYEMLRTRAYETKVSTQAFLRALIALAAEDPRLAGKATRRARST